jgi:hypothetical protein
MESMEITEARTRRREMEVIDRQRSQDSKRFLI